MAKRKGVEDPSSDAVAGRAPEKAETGSELPAVESPSISPAVLTAASDPAAETPVQLIATTAGESHSSTPGPSGEETSRGAALQMQASTPTRWQRPRYKRHALLATSVAIAAVFGALVGAVATGGFSKPAALDVAAVEENRATQQSVTHLAREIAGLKASLEAANKSAQSQITKISERLSREGAGITGSITPPQAIPSAAQTSAPLPTARSAPAAEAPLPSRLSIVADWSIRETRDGYVYVQGHGDVYQVVPGAPLPGLGPVEQIKRQDGRWLVVTPKGIIVSMRDRRYFEQF